MVLENSVHSIRSRNSAGVREAGGNPAQPRYCKRGGSAHKATVPATGWEGGPVRRGASQETGRRIKTDRLSREEPEMLKNATGLWALCLSVSACLSAAQIKGKIVDASGAPVSGAQVALVNRVGVLARGATTSSGTFDLDAAETAGARIVVTAPGFRMRT